MSSGGRCHPSTTCGYRQSLCRSQSRSAIRSCRRWQSRSRRRPRSLCRTRYRSRSRSRCRSRCRVRSVDLVSDPGLAPIIGPLAGAGGVEWRSQTRDQFQSPSQSRARSVWRCLGGAVERSRRWAYPPSPRRLGQGPNACGSLLLHALLLAIAPYYTRAGV